MYLFVPAVIYTMSSDIVTELHALADLAGKSSHKYIAYSAAARSIEDSGYDLRDYVARGEKPTIPYVGPKIWAIIVDYYTSGGKPAIRRELEARNAAREAFTKMQGVANVTADEWISNGVLTINQLRDAVAADKIHLNHVQSLGLIYYEDLNTRIPRAEVTAISEKMAVVIKESLRGQLARDPICTGSWRRGLSDSGDIDMLVAVHDKNSTKAAIATIARGLSDARRTGIEAHIMSEGATRITLLARGWAYMRQVDILVVPESEYGAALLYFTGSWEFNESMRRYAKQQGFRLNQRGLFRSADMRLVASATEESIFDALGLKWLPPAERTGEVYG